SRVVEQEHRDPLRSPNPHYVAVACFFFSSRRRHTRSDRDWSSDVCSSDLRPATHLRSVVLPELLRPRRTKNSFSSTCKSTPSTAWTLSAPVLNALLSEWMLITADLRSCRKNSLHESPCIRHKNRPFPSFPKRGWRFTEKFPPLKKGVWTGNKGNKRTGDIGNSFHGGSDWAQRFLEGGTG